MTALTLFLGTTYSGGTPAAFADGPDTASTAAPRLAWTARGEDKSLLKGLSFELQGPRGEELSEGDNRWEDAPAVRVVDNTGQRDYEGLDEDPEPGLFLVTHLYDEDAGLDDVEDGAAYRVTPLDSDDEDARAADDAEWTKLEASALVVDPVVVTVKPKPADSAATGTDVDGEVGRVDERRKSDDQEQDDTPTATKSDAPSVDETDLQALDEPMAATFALLDPCTGNNCANLTFNSTIGSGVMATPEDWEYRATYQADNDWYRFNLGSATSTVTLPVVRNRAYVISATPKTSLAATYSTTVSCSGSSGASGGSWSAPNLTLGTNRSWSCSFTHSASTRPSVTVKVNKQVLRSDVGTAAQRQGYLTGATFQLQASATGSAIAFPGGSCTIPSNQDYCNITVPGGMIPTASTSYYVVETTAGAGTFAVGEIATGTATGALTARPYPGSTGNLPTNGGTVNVPQTPSSGEYSSIGKTVNSVINPAKTPTCQAGLRVGLVLDTSSSIDSNERSTYATAVRGLVNALGSAGGVQISTITFNSAATAQPGLSGTADSTLATKLYDYLRPNSGSSGTFDAATNWDAALDLAAGGSYDVILMVTDGAPTQSRSTTSADSVRIFHVEQAVLSSNAAKIKGMPVWAVGVAMPTGSASNLQAISGKEPGADYFTADDWADLQRELVDIAKGLTCTLPIEVTKTTISTTGTTTNNAGGWMFTPASGGDTGPSLANDPRPTTAPYATAQTTVANNTVRWDLSFTKPTGQKANLTLAENPTDAQQADWTLTKVECSVGTGALTERPVVNGAVTLSDLTATSGKVFCKFTNTAKKLSATVTVRKTMQDANGLNPVPTANWTMGAALTGAPTTGTSISPATTQATAATTGTTPPWTISFPTASASTDVRVWEAQQTGYAFVSGSCAITTAGVARTVSVASTEVVLSAVKPGDTVACEFVNKLQAGAVTWEKVDDSTPLQRLAGSEWKIVGTTPATTALTVPDCVASAPGGCATAADTDNRAGGFRVAGLAWGSYQLIETKAPPGYVLDATPRPFVVGETALEPSLGQIRNSIQGGPVLPLTGGFGRDHVYLAGALLLLLSLAGFGSQRLRAGRTTRRA